MFFVRARVGTHEWMQPRKYPVLLFAAHAYLTTTGRNRVVLRLDPISLSLTYLMEDGKLLVSRPHEEYEIDAIGLRISRRICFLTSSVVRVSIKQNGITADQLYLGYSVV